MPEIFSDSYFMQKALQEAKTAFNKGEVPVGAIIVSDNRIIAKAHNLTESLNDVTAHAEMQAITSAANILGGKYLKKCTLYVTIEPCTMCASGLALAQIGKIVYGASDEKMGYSLYAPGILHPTTKIKNGVLEEQCRDVIQKFFLNKRKTNK